MLNIIIQGILSLFLVFIMAFIAYSVYNNEYVKKINDIIISGNKRIIPIFKGRFEFGSRHVKIETFNPNYLGYLNINPSKNQNGGAEYSYNFWLFYHISAGDKINKNMDETDYIILFFKGSAVKSLTYNTNNYECTENGDKKILIKNPLVKLRNDGKELLVEYNNINFPESYNNNAKKIDCNYFIDPVTKIRTEISEDRNNILTANRFGIKNINTGYYNDKFNMITIVFQENPSNEEVFNNNNANYRIYLNAELVEDRLANTNNIENSNTDFKSRVIKNNNNKLHINPINYDNTNKENINPITEEIVLTDQLTHIQPLQIADFTYFNYAISSAEINALYKKSFNTYLAKIDNELSLSDYEYKNKYSTYPSKELSKPI